jgi:beta-galactosidase
MESFKASEHKAFHGLCLAIVQSNEKPGTITLRATSNGLRESSVTITTR